VRDKDDITVLHTPNDPCQALANKKFFGLGHFEKSNEEKGGIFHLIISGNV
jgi:hypothetical protein